MPDTGSGFVFLWPAKSWEHRKMLRRKHPFLYWTSLAIILGLIVPLVALSFGRPGN